MTVGIATALFVAALGVFHMLLPDLAWRWRQGRSPDAASRRAVRFLGAVLLIGGLAGAAFAAAS